MGQGCGQQADKSHLMQTPRRLSYARSSCRHDGSSRLSHTRSCCCVMMFRSQSRDFLKRALSESGRAKAIFSLCRGNAQPASTQALRVASELSSEPIVAYGAIANIQSRPQLEPEQRPSYRDRATIDLQAQSTALARGRRGPAGFPRSRCLQRDQVDLGSI
jgi:hypothetical protein